jgi:hypothetical protein
MNGSVSSKQYAVSSKKDVHFFALPTAYRLLPIG